LYCKIPKGKEIPLRVSSRNCPLEPGVYPEYAGQQRANTAKRPDFTPDRPTTPDELAAFRLRLSRMSPTALLDAYFAAWSRCKMERDGKPPQARSSGNLCELEGTTEGKF
ncbi:MAG TPA: hypothetical protein VM709_08055, partial [Candidatus Sulfotelmatobacter sp.]|nr:hypothetical protein [Candidatus Sulfotelmatobacter sp.]